MGVRDWQGSGDHLPPGILGKVPHHGRPLVLEGSPESVHSAVKCTLGRQAREGVAQVAADLGEKAPFAGTPQQVADQSDREHLGIGVDRRQPGRDGIGTRLARRASSTMTKTWTNKSASGIIRQGLHGRE